MKLCSRYLELPNFFKTELKIALGKKVEQSVNAKIRVIVTNLALDIAEFPSSPFFATPLTSFINFINFVRPSVHAVLVYAYNPMEQTHNTFNMAWLMQQLTSAYALVEVYPVLQGKLSQTDRRTSWVIGKLHFQ